MSAKGMMKTVIVTELRRRGAMNEMQADYLVRALETMYEEGFKDGIEFVPDAKDLTCSCLDHQECPVCLGLI